jgi:signal transduction histidine kinase
LFAATAADPAGDGTAAPGADPGAGQDWRPASRAPSRRALKNWRVRSRLLLLITIPTLTAVILGGIRIVSSVQSALAYQRVENMANLASQVTGLANALENERDQIASYIALPESQGGRAAKLAELAHQKIPADVAQNTASNLFVVQQTISYTRPWVNRVKQAAAAIGASYPQQARQQAQALVAQVNALPSLRDAALTTQLPVLDVVQKYTTTIDNLLAVESQVALGSSDADLAGTVRALGLVSRIEEEFSQQRALLTVAFTQGGFPPGVLAAVNDALAQQNSNLNEFSTTATAAQRALYNTTVSGSLVDRANAQEQQAISNPSLTDNSTTADDWYGASSSTLGKIRLVEQQLVASTIARASSLRNQAITFAVLVGAAVFVVLALALIFTAIVGRSMVRPLRRLRAGALEIAGLRLPETVRRMSEADGEAVSLDVAPIDVDSLDEIGEVARAFDQVHREALRLAANEAALRGNVNAMFVNLSRRSQSLVERQIRLIDSLEQGEQDPERLASLFQMDHLATRMRRNSENLLVLAGHDASRRWTQPVALVDVLRAAVSEIEQYERVTLNVQPGISVRGQAVNDVVHLLAELAENATSFSSAETPVAVSGHLLTSGGVLLDITDQGVGMGAEEMAHANWRLDNPPVVDVAVSRRMGLFVVARLAARHGIRVRLRPAAAGGLTALVWLPEEVVTHDAAATPVPGPRRAELVGGPAYLADRDEPAPPAPRDEVRPDHDLVPGAAGPGQRPPESADTSADTPLGPRRVPGTTGSRPGSAWASTGPIPALSGEIRPEVSDPAVTSPQPAVRADEQPGPGPADHELGGAQEAAPAAVSYAAFGPPADFGPGPEPGDSAETPDLAGPAGDKPEPSGHPAEPEEVPAAQTRVNGGSADPLSPRAGALAGFGWDSGHGNGSDSEVIVPAPQGLEENRLPIFEAVESDWFRRGRNTVGLAAQATRDGDAQPASAAGWVSPADEGWRAAEVAAAPTSAGTTEAGLPKRVPQANLVPGAAPTGPSASPVPAAPVPVRSAAATRERFASFQRGAREGRAAGRSEGTPDGEDATS